MQFPCSTLDTDDSTPDVNYVTLVNLVTIILSFFLQKYSMINTKGQILYDSTYMRYHITVVKFTKTK